MTPMTPTSAMPMSRIMRLAHHHLLLAAPPHHQRQKTRDGKENAVHDPEHEAGLQHRARFVRVHAYARTGRRKPDEGDVPEGGGGGGAVGVRDEAQLVDGADEGADEEQVDEGYEERIGLGAVVGEERAEGPAGAQHGDDEED